MNRMSSLIAAHPFQKFSSSETKFDFWLSIHGISSKSTASYKIFHVFFLKITRPKYKKRVLA
ncbi:MAG: hypothetical protein PUH74_06865, partial [Bacteroidales bacterium]|nr:hypothetical protein [Bacteroidales bacterium]